MQKVLKILIPIAMLCVVFGIWWTQSAPVEAVEEELATPLHVSSVDIATLTADDMPIIIDFGADECVPCKAMAPVLETLNAEMQGKAVIQFVDVWKNPEAAAGFPLQVIPTQVLINADGSPYVPSELVAQQLEFSAYSDRETQEHVFTTHQGGLTEEQMRLILEDMGALG